MAETISDLVSRADPPLYVVTTIAGGERSGCVVGFAAQVSIDPPRFLAALSKANRTWHVASRATHLAVHAITHEHMALVALFGGETGDDVDKFDLCAWSDGPAGVPVLDEAAAWFVGRVPAERYDLGDHVGHLLEPIGGATDDSSDGDVVTLNDAKDVEPGHPA